jgi:alpha-tubulin suppressor-like RCC1 family protein
MGQVTAIAAAMNHTLAVKSDGTVWSTGANNYGQLGYGYSDTGPHGGFMPVPDLDGVISVDTFWDYSIALKTDGTVWTWGSNTDGQLGRSGDPLVPGQVEGLGGVVNQIAAGMGTVVVRKSDGTVWTWGRNIGSTPIQIPSLTGATSIDAGQWAGGVALKDGNVWVWGDDPSIYGNGSITVSPVPVQANISGVTKLVAGSLYIFAITGDGSLWAWGNNFFGQLGNGTTGGTVTVPTLVAGITNVIDAAGGMGQSLALRGGGSGPITFTVTASAGPNGSIDPSGSAIVNRWSSQTFTVTAYDGYYPVMSGTCGGALSGTGPLYTYTTWPINADCTVIASFSNTNIVTPSAGPNGTISPSTPQTVIYTTTSSFTVTPAEGYHIESVTGCGGTLSDNTYTTAPITADCTVTATFAINSYTVTPTAGPHGSISPAKPQTVTHGATTSFNVLPDYGYHIETVTGCGGALSGNTYTTAPITADCTVTASFAINSYTVTPTAGPHGSISPSTPQTVNFEATISFNVTPDPDHYIATVTGCGGIWTGSNPYTAVISSDCTVSATFTETDTRNLRAWGDNSMGQLGDGTTIQRPSPTQILSLNGVTAISGGYDFSIALKSDGSVCGWGNGNWGQTGNYEAENPIPIQVEGLTNAVAVAAGEDHSMVLKSNGSVWTYGNNSYGQLGVGYDLYYGWTSQPVQAFGGGVTKIAAGASFSLALTDNGDVYGWGNNWYGQLGDDSSWKFLSPKRIWSLGGVTTQIAAGFGHSIALKSDGTVWTWGRNEDGELGIGTSDYDQHFTPVQVTGLNNHTIIGIAAGSGSAQSFAIESGGIVWAWGNGQRTPVQIGLTNVTKIAVGELHAIALKADGTVWAWGSNDYGQIGIGGTGGYIGSPTQVTALSSAVGVGAGSRFSMAFTTDTVPTPFFFTDQTGVPLHTQITSNPINVAKIDAPAQISITGGEYSINGGAFTSSNGSVNNGDIVTVRQTSSDSYTTTTDAILSIGGVSDTFSLTTIACTNILSVTIIGNGVVHSSPSPDINCTTGTCIQSYTGGTSVQLTATPAAGWVLTNWAGCDSLNGTVCTVSMSAAKNVTANFSAIAWISVSPATHGYGTVQVGSSSSAQSFTISNTAGANLIVTSISTTGTDNAMFSLSSGTCGSLTPTILPGASCSIDVVFTPTASGNRSAALHIVSNSSVNPTLDIPLTGSGIIPTYSLTFTKLGPDGGRVYSSPAGIDLTSGTISALYASGTHVSLTAESAAGSIFSGWGGSCSGTSLCEVIMNANTSVTASFKASVQETIIDPPPGSEIRIVIPPSQPLEALILNRNIALTLSGALSQLTVVTGSLTADGVTIK